MTSVRSLSSSLSPPDPDKSPGVEQVYGASAAEKLCATALGALASGRRGSRPS